MRDQQALKIDSEFKTVIPPLSESERAELERSILAEGCRDPLVVWRGLLVDGHNRYEICRRHGIPFKTVERRFEGRSHAKAWIIENQFARRNLSALQRSELALELKDVYAARAKERQRLGGRNKVRQICDEASGRTDEQLATIAGVSRATIRKVEAITRFATQSQRDRVARGDISIHRLHNEIMRARSKPSVGQAPPLPSGRYGLILADPPWPYEFSITVRDRIDQQYPPLSVEEICAMAPKVGQLAERNAVLYLWATAPKLPEALRVMEAWGFHYKSCGCWDKTRPGAGFWFMGQHELLLVGTKGKMSPPAEGLRDPSVHRGSRTIHSEKPDYYYKMLERQFSHLNKIELFARRRRAGWTSWGNELGSKSATRLSSESA
jgi:N6-adenosine-specific RNA methylase IME4